MVMAARSHGTPREVACIELTRNNYLTYVVANAVGRAGAAAAACTHLHPKGGNAPFTKCSDTTRSRIIINIIYLAAQTSLPQQYF